MGKTAGPRRVLMIVQNLPVPLDRRVWLECQALAAQGYGVSVICPKGPGDLPFEEIDGIHIFKYEPAPEARNALGFAIEFAYSWVRTAWLSIRVWQRYGFDVIQACNPPDTYWLLALLWKLRGVRFVFDQHDLNPELYLSRFGEPVGFAGRVQFNGLSWLERSTYRVADRVLSTNESYKRVAERRGRLPSDRVTIVRSGPDTTVMRPIYPSPPIRAGAEHLIAYIGIMGPQDGVENILAVMDDLVHRRGRTGIRAVLLGFGDCLEALRRESTERGLDDHIIFTGRVGPDQIAQYLSSADLGLGPDLNTPLNNVSTMNKTMEYMAYGLPAVSFDLIETRVSAADTGIYVASGDLKAFADEVEGLLDDPERRVRMGLSARQRVADLLDWRPQAEAYVGVFHELLGEEPDHSLWPYTPRPVGSPDPTAPVPVDLADEVELRRFLRERTAPTNAT